MTDLRATRFTDIDVNSPNGDLEFLSSADDYLRLIKRLLKNNLSTLDKPLTITSDQLNLLAAAIIQDLAGLSIQAESLIIGDADKESI